MSATPNPYGSPPRIPGRFNGRAITWFGERWWPGDACRAVGIHPNTYRMRRRKGERVSEALRPTHSLPPTRPPAIVPTHGKVQLPRAFAIVCVECRKPATVMSPAQRTCNPCRYKAAGYEAAR